MADICQRCISTETKGFDKFIHFASYFLNPGGLFGDIHQCIMPSSLLTCFFNPFLLPQLIKKPSFS